MSHDQNSGKTLIQMNTAEVIAACDNYIKLRTEANEILLNEYRAYYATKKKYFFFGRLLNSNEIERIIRGDGFVRGISFELFMNGSCIYDTIQMTSSFSLYKIKLLKSAVSVTKCDIIQMSIDDVNLIKNFLNPVNKTETLKEN